jgi:hypothetical protein
VGEIAADAAAVPVGLAMWAGDGFMLIIGAVLMAKVLRR